MKKILSHISKKYRTTVHNYRMRSSNKVWAKRVSDAVALFPGKAETAIAQALLDNQVRLLRTQGAAMHLGAYEQVKTQDKTAYCHFQTAVKVLTHLLPLIRIVGVQPMKGPVGSVYLLTYKEEPTELVDKIPGHLLDGVKGVRIKLEVVSKTVEARTRKLHARWALEAAQNLSALHGVDVEKEISEAMAYEIANEIYAEVLQDLKILGSKTNVFEWDASTNASGEANLPLASDKARVLAIRINQACGAIAHKTRRGAGNFIVVSPIVLAALQMDKNGTFESSPDAAKYNYSPLKLVGTLNSTIQVWLNTYSTNHDILVGYMGTSGMIDTGYVYSPYILLMPTGVVIDPITFQPCINMLTRYGKNMFEPSVTERIDSQNYYAIVKVKNLDNGGLFGLDLDVSVDTVTTSA